MENFDFSEFDRTQYESKDHFQYNSKMQQALVKHVLHFHPDEDPKPTSLEFFFCTDTPEIADGLCKDLKKLGYDAVVGISLKDRWSIIGCTTEMNIDDSSLEGWAREMCEVGYKNDCRFDGWGMGMEL